jgi:hypothetical protein
MIAVPNVRLYSADQSILWMPNLLITLIARGACIEKLIARGTCIQKVIAHGACIQKLISRCTCIQKLIARGPVFRNRF